MGNHEHGAPGAGFARTVRFARYLHARCLPSRRHDRARGGRIDRRQGRALSAHRSKAYDGYAKRTEKRALAATRKRHAHRIALEKAAEIEGAEISETASKALTDKER